MSSAIEGLKPAALWKHFADLARVPRGSKHEEKAAAFVIAHAKRLGLEWAQDRVGNVVVRMPASPGRERQARVCLQGHLDMVCEKRPDVRHDFAKDPIRLVRDGDLMRADGTTLGADNGVAVATCLALMEDRSIEHGPLEFLFTIDEETGLTGAQGLQPGFLKSTTLLNLDLRSAYAEIIYPFARVGIGIIADINSSTPIVSGVCAGTSQRRAPLIPPWWRQV